MNSAPLHEGLWYAVRRNARIRAWELSGAFIARYYERLLRCHGGSPQALDERSDLKDFSFYRYLFRDVTLSSPLSVLDIGSGLGDMIGFLQTQTIELQSYLGIDLVRPFVAQCQLRYPSSCRFQQANFISRSFQPAEKFDLVVNMGGLVSRVVRYEEYVAHSIDKMIAHTRGHVLFNLITEVDRSLGNYKWANWVGNITYIPKDRLVRILDQITAKHGAQYEINEVRIYPDATDAFVRIRVGS